MRLLLASLKMFKKNSSISAKNNFQAKHGINLLSAWNDDIIFIDYIIGKVNLKYFLNYLKQN